jgi:hypothetical protein
METGKSDITKSAVKISEKKLERRLISEVKKLGGKALKFYSPYETGFPDRLVLLHGRCHWVELKSTGKKLSPRQRIVCGELNTLGFIVHLISTEQALEGFIKYLKAFKWNS